MEVWHRYVPVHFAEFLKDYRTPADDCFYTNLSSAYPLIYLSH